MKYFFIFFSCLFLGFMSQQAAAQCGAGQSLVEIIVRTDNYGTETNWQLTDGGSTTYGSVNTQTYANATLYTHTFCVPSASCTRFRMADSYGDGICCNYGSGYYLLIVDGDTLARDSSFGRERITQFNCPQGSVCSNPITITQGSYTTTYDEQWYWFSPAVTGMYNFNTCGGNGCDTKIWIYDNCNHNFDSSNVGTLYYNDNSCGLRSSLDAALAAGTSYLIRVSDRGNACNGNIGFNIVYNGPVTGCTDPAACNYNPLATVSDTCIYFGNPNCPNGPDLLLRQDVIRNSLQLTSYNSVDPCLATEECVSGMGMRDIVRFTTHIENNGQRDYYVGVPGPNNPQFTYGNCHNHWHHESYAQYILFDAQGNMLPIGMKNGFCVMDLTCDHGGTAQYGCGNMGISMGCGDIYDRSLQCQWVDVTNVPDGDYQLVIRVNWNYSPDALGVYETNYDNNWANACFNLSRATGTLQMTILPNCAVYTDCMGVPFGTAIRDCDGVCNGTGIRGDVNSNQSRETTDVDNYLQHVTAQDLSATECIDLHRDSTLNVYDAALLQRCLQDSSRCNFPTGLYNSVDTVGLSIIGVDFAQNYVDIGIRNPSNKVLAYQFGMAGIVIDSVVSLINPSLYNVQPVFNANTSVIAALPNPDSSIQRGFSVQQLCRVYFSQINAAEICIDSIYSIVSNQYQALAHKIEGGCVQPSVVAVENMTNAPLTIKVAPNPFKNSTVVSFENNVAPLRLQLYDALGALVQQQDNVTARQYILNRNNLASGVYFLKISADNSQQTVKIVIE